MVLLQTWVKNMDKKTKKDIRAEVKRCRREASAETIRKNSEIICNQFLELPEYAVSDTVFAYMDCKNEVETKNVIEQCWKDGKTIAVPKVLRQSRHACQRAAKFKIYL